MEDAGLWEPDEDELRLSETAEEGPGVNTLCVVITEDRKIFVTGCWV